jgi:hypothetical protein
MATVIRKLHESELRISIFLHLAAMLTLAGLLGCTVTNVRICAMLLRNCHIALKIIIVRVVFIPFDKIERR